MANKEELNLCPFCNETVGIQILTTGDRKDPIGYGSVIKGQVLCSSRNCLLEEFSHRKYYSGGFKLKSEDHKNYQREVAEYVTIAWNHRQPDKELTALKEFARKVIDINCFNSEPDGLTIQEQAEELGLIELYTLVEGDDFDDSEWSVGDKQYKFSEILKEKK